MNYAETNPVLRRIRAYLVSPAGSPVTGLTPTTIEVTGSGDTLAAAAGSFVEVGSGVYYYEATELEATTQSFLALKVTDASIRTFVWFEDIGARIAIGETLGLRRRLPIYLKNSSGVPVTGAALGTGGVLEVSVSGAAFAAATGTWGEAGGGLYYYELSEAEVADEGFVVLKVIASGAEPYVFTHDLMDPEAEFEGGSAGYFGYYFGTGGIDTGTTVTPTTPVPAPTVLVAATVTSHVQAAIDRLPEYVKSKVSDD